MLCKYFIVHLLARVLFCYHFGLFWILFYTWFDFLYCNNLIIVLTTKIIVSSFIATINVFGNSYGSLINSQSESFDLEVVHKYNGNNTVKWSIRLDKRLIWAYWPTYVGIWKARNPYLEGIEQQPYKVWEWVKSWSHIKVQGPCYPKV